jgi:hypothetical protein
VIITGQVSAGTAVANLVRMPPGPCMVVVTNPGTVTAYVGPGTSLSSSNGMPVPAGQSLTWAGYQGGHGAQLQVVASSGTASSTVAFLVSTATGDTGL